MGKYTGYLIASDIDGTLTVEGALPEANLDAIRRFQAEGGRFTICTGRTPGYLPTLPFRCNAPTATINGTLLCDTDGTPLVRMPLYDSVASLLPALLEKFESIPYVERYFENEVVGWSRDTHGTDYSVLVTPKTTYKYIFACGSEENAFALIDYLKEVCGDLCDVTRCAPPTVELIAKNSGKGACLRHMRRLLPDVHTFIAVGDFDNDLTMIKEADIGCAVGNAGESVKAIADRVICRNDECAIAYIVDTLIPSLEKR